MYVTTRYIGIQRGQMDYLFFLLTEDYIEQNRRIAESLAPLLERFGRNLGKAGALVKPFPGDERNTLGDILRKGWSHGDISRMRKGLPALLITDTDFDNFDPRNNNYLYVSLRNSIDENGDVKVFLLASLFDELVLGANQKDLFSIANEYLQSQRERDFMKEWWKTIEIKPGVLGISVDLKAAIELFKFLRQKP